MKPYDQITIRLQRPGMADRKHKGGGTNTSSAEATQLNWGDVLTNARRRPGIYIGSPSEAHLEALRGACNFVALAHPFRQPEAIHIVCSPTQYIVRCTAGPLVKSVERSVDWNMDRMLIDLLGDPYFYRSEHSFTLQGTHPVPLADRFFVGITSRTGFRHQTYREGWPTTEVLLLAKKTSYSFVIAGQLTPEWFTGLPFKWKDVRSVVNEYRSVHATWDVRTSDDILPMNDDDMAELCL